MDNYNKKPRSVNKKQYIEDLDIAREAWKEDEKKLTIEKEKLGYGDHTPQDFLNMIPEIANLEHEKASAILVLQEAYGDLEEQKKLLWPEETIVEELNKIHATIHTDQFYILTEKVNPVFGGKDFTLESKQSFKNQYEPYFITCSDGEQRSKADVWLKSRSRRSYQGITFDPTGDEKMKGLYNLWKGFQKVAQQGDASKYWIHVKENICNGNEETYIFVRRWLAYVFQHPHEVHTALVLVGSQGVGKNSFVEPLGVLFGPHYVLLSSISELVSNFNFHLKNAVLIHANEALWGGNRKDIGTVKAMITEKTCLIEGKGKDRIMVRNFKHLILSSNEDWPVHMDRDDRRFYVLRISEEHKNDTAYFAVLQEQLDNGGYEALLYDLLHEDLSEFNPRKLPHSIEAFDIKLLGLDSPDRYIYAALQEGHFCLADENANEQGVWQKEIPKNMVHKDYAAWCSDNREKAESVSKFGKILKKLVPSIKGDRASKAPRVTVYQLPALETARQEFCKAFNEQPRIFETLNKQEDEI